MTEERIKDEVAPAGKWAFDADVTAAFDDMLARSIPQYEVMRKACFDVGSKFVTPNTTVLDLGCSRGEALAAFVERFGACNSFVGVEVSQPMLTAFKEKFRGLIDAGIVKAKNSDLRKEYPPVRASLTLCVLTLQFVPIEHRLKVVSNMHKHATEGGAVVLVEKILGSSADLDSAFAGVYYDMKKTNGYTQDQIDRKKMSLEGVLVPVTAKWNEELLRGAGFSQVDCFWRWMNFAAWVAIK